MFKLIFLLTLLNLIDDQNLCHNNLINLCPNHLNITRRDMPQLGSVFMNHIISHPKIESTCCILKPDQLTSTQNEIHLELVIKLLSKSYVNQYKSKEPIFASFDGHVLDGHHRWAAHYLLNEDIPVILINIGIKDLLVLANGFSEAVHL